MTSDGNTGAPRRRHKNTKTDRPARNRANAEAVLLVPRSIEWTLRNHKLTRPRFTPFAWEVLKWSWIEPDAYTGSWTFARQPRGRAAKILGEPAPRVLQAKREAERLAWELCYVWYPALRRWERGERLDPYDRLVLKRHSRAKKGRREAPEADVEIAAGHPQRDAMGPTSVGGWSALVDDEPGGAEEVKEGAGVGVGDDGDDLALDVYDDPDIYEAHAR